jgi:hypothetical protein
LRNNSVLPLISGGAAIHRCDNRFDWNTALAAEGTALAHKRLFPPPARWLRAVVVPLAIFSAATVFPRLAAADSTKPAPCATAEHRQFDFWIGDWDAFEVGDATTKSARTRVELLLDGCVLHEIYDDANGLHGESLNIYDTSRKVWHQSWVTNRGQLLIIEGKMQGGEIALEGEDRTADGKPRKVRGTWKPVDGGVRETAVTSTDGGKTWKPWFDMVLRPHKP